MSSAGDEPETKKIAVVEQVVGDGPQEKMGVKEPPTEMVVSELGAFAGRGDHKLLQFMSYGRTASLLLKEAGESERRSIVLLEKVAWSEEEVAAVLRRAEEATAAEMFSNDIYSAHLLRVPSELNRVKATCISPCTEEHIVKYSPQEYHLVEETPEMYAAVTRAVAEAGAARCQWVENILSGTAEAERVVLRDADPDTGFVLLPDMKWDGKNITTLHLLAITQQRILSIRELTAAHIPLIKKMKTEILRYVVEKHVVAEDKLLVYFHYQPTFYWLHVHVILTSNELPAGTGCEKAHLLTHVLSNLNIASDYYSRATLQFSLRGNDKLYTAVRHHMEDSSQL